MRRPALLLLLAFLPIACGPADAPTPGAPNAVLALFPFEARGPETPEYLVDGVRRELMVGLARLEGLRVLTPAAPDLAAGHGVTGTVVRRDGEMRVDATLVDLVTGDTVWSGAAAGDRSELARLETEILAGLAAAVGRPLSAAERDAAARAPTDDTEAHDLYLRGHHLGRVGEASAQEARGRLWREAVPPFEEAVHRDPEFARAWAGLALSHLRLHWFRYDRTPERLARARAAVERAAALAPRDPEVLTTEGYWHYWGRQDYRAALERYRAAEEEAPGDMGLSVLIAYVLRRQGGMDEAAHRLMAASDLDPTDAALAMEAGDTWHALRRWPEARRLLDRSRARAPQHPGAWLSLGWVALGESGDTAAARRWFEEGAERAGAENFLFARWRLAMLAGRPDEALALADDARASGREAFVLPFQLTPVDQMAGFALRAAGRKDEARARFEAAAQLLERLAPEYGDDHRIHRARALTLAALGERAAALAAADRGVAELPLQVDAFVGGEPLEDRARVRTLVGDTAGALDDLERLAEATNLVPLTPALLSLDPDWDPLRDEPRFQALSGGR